ncbi:MAG TPA: hypothetical protein VFV23_07415 [Verrucomicrobiae bacterium]|nr:hypothetical protein [Verrucomicrobiae bacterium]
MAFWLDKKFQWEQSQISKSTEIKRRAYSKLRDIIERHGGIMEYRRQGYQHGAWEISLNGKRAIIEATGALAFPPLDRLFIPKVENPKTWNDYSETLIPDAERQLLALLV